jgi:hypothetical protein
MFFHVNSVLMKVAHEWLSWLLVIGAVAHLALNWRPFVAYFRKPAALAIMGLFLAIGIVSFIPLGGMSGRRPPMMQLFGALEQSSLEVVAQVVQKTPDDLTQELASQGITVRDPRQTIREIAAENGRNAMEILGQVAGKAGATSGGRGGSRH